MATHLIHVVLLAVENLGHFGGGVLRPLSILELTTEIKNEQRVLELDEDVAPVHCPFALIVPVGDVLDVGVPVLVVPVDLHLELLLAVSAWKILDAEIGTQVLTPHDLLHIDGVIVV